LIDQMGQGTPMVDVEEDNLPESARSSATTFEATLVRWPGPGGWVFAPVPREHAPDARVTTDEHVHLRAAAAEEECGLPGGVAATYDRNRPGAAGLGFCLGGRVIHPDALELFEPVQR
jgi:hypothetical protein